MDVFDLVARLSLDSSEYESGLSKAEKSAGTAGNKFKTAFGTAAKVGAGFSAAVVAGGAALYGMSKKSADTADHIDKMSQKIGISREAYQEFDFIASQSGADVDQLRVGMKTLTNQMGSAVSGTGSAADAFKTLGISVTDSEGNMKSQEDMLWETLDALQGVENQTERAALANQLFGKSGSDLMPLINGARGSIHDMRDEAHELGLVMGDETIDAGVKLTDTIDKVQRSFGVIVTKIGAEVMPIVQNVLDMILENMPTIQSVMSSVFDVITKVVGTFIDVLKSLYNYVQENIVPVLSDVWSNTIQPAISNAFSAIQEAWTNVLQPALQAIWSFITETLAPAVKTAWEETIKPAIISVFDAVSEAWTNVLKPALDALWDFVQNTVAPIVVTALETMQEAGEAVFYAIQLAWEKVLKPALEALKDFVDTTLKPIFTKAFAVMQATVSVVFDAIKGYWEEVLTPVFDAIKDTVTAVKNAFKKAWEGTGSVKTIVEDSWNSIKKIWENTFKKVWTGMQKVIEDLQTKYQDVWDAIHGKVDEVWSDIRNIYDSTLGVVFSTISEAVDGAKEKFNSVLDTAKTVFGLGEGSIWGAISGVIDKIKGVFDFSWELPKIKLPHFSWTWHNLGLISIPSISVEWYRKAYQNPFLFNGKTILGNLGFGDSNGGEIVYGHDNLMRDIREATAGNRGHFNVTINVTQNPDESQEELATRISEIISEQYNRQEAVFA